jgi:hypothetical protein
MVEITVGGTRTGAAAVVKVLSLAIIPSGPIMSLPLTVKENPEPLRAM